MPAYPVIAIGLIAVAVLVRLVAQVRARRLGRAIPWRPTLLAALVLIVLTIVFDNVMIAADLFGYAEDEVLGWWIGLAPVEDLSYPLATAIALPAVLSLMTRRADE